MPANANLHVFSSLPPLQICWLLSECFSIKAASVAVGTSIIECLLMEKLQDC
jgi:hypothetical protein